MWFWSTQCNSKARLDGKTVLITGANTGIGKATAEELYKKGAHVLMACRVKERGEAAIKDIIYNCLSEQNVGTLQFVKLDLADFKSIRECTDNVIKNVKQIDILINNAGIYCCPESKTKDGFEMQFGVNHLGHFLFTLLLLPKLITSTDPCRIVNVASNFHKGADLKLDDLNYEKRSYSAIKAYNTSKLCNILFTKELAKKLKEKGINNITVYAPHPGYVFTEVNRYLDDTYGYGTRLLWKLTVGWWIQTPLQGSQTVIHCAIDEEAGKETGFYYNACKPEIPARNALDAESAKKLWDVSIDFCKLKGFNPFVK